MEFSFAEVFYWCIVQSVKKWYYDTYHNFWVRLLEESYPLEMKPGSFSTNQEQNSEVSSMNIKMKCQNHADVLLSMSEELSTMKLLFQNSQPRILPSSLAIFIASIKLKTKFWSSDFWPKANKSHSWNIPCTHSIWALV